MAKRTGRRVKKNNKQRYPFKVYEHDLVRRAYDGKWEHVVRIPDHDNEYRYELDSGQTVKLVPTKWVTMKVYDLLADVTIED